MNALSGSTMIANVREVVGRGADLHLSRAGGMQTVTLRGSETWLRISTEGMSAAMPSFEMRAGEGDLQ